MNYLRKKYKINKNIKNNKINKNIKKNHLIYLSMTTRPERIKSEHFLDVYNSLKNQTIKFDKLIINLCIDEFVFDIPEKIKLLPDIIINETKYVGPCSKLLGGLDKIPIEAIVIILDDDMIMHQYFIEQLYTSFLKYPNSVSSHFIIERPYFKEVVGSGGYMVKRLLLEPFKEYYKTMPSICKNIDDTWISWCFNEMKISVKIINHSKPIYKSLKSLDFDWYQLQKDTNRYKLIKDIHKIWYPNESYV